MNLPKRLSSCLNYTQGFKKLADIGTDHALLPIAAVEEGFVISAIAIDNKIGPFSIAYNNVKQSNVSDKISVLLSDGFDKVDVDVDVVVISGMGGSLIADIVLKHSLRNVKRFILQPNNDSDVIRRTMSSIGFIIVDELIVNENNKLYDVIVFERGETDYSELEIQFGPVNLKSKPHFFVKRIEEEKTRLTSLLEQVKDKERIEIINKRLALLKEAL